MGLSGCVAYPLDRYPEDRDHGAQRDRGRDQDREQRDDNRGGHGDHRPDCDLRSSDCPRH